MEGFMNDVIHDNHIRSMVEGRSAYGHFKDQYAETPPIDHLVIGFPEDDLGRQVLRSAAESVSVFLWFNCLGQTEVSQLHMTITVEQYVLGLDVSINEPHAMEMVKG